MSGPIDLDTVRRHGTALVNDDGQQRPEVAEAIAAAGPLLLELAAENEAQRAALALIERSARDLDRRFGALVARLEVLP